LNPNPRIKSDDRYAAALLAAGFVHVNTVLLRRIHALIVIEHGTRGAHLAGVTAHPDGWWTTQAVGIRILLSPPQAPRANAACQRMIGTLRRELFDRLLIVNEHHLRRVARQVIVALHR
jgi:hypothetical protein